MSASCRRRLMRMARASMFVWCKMQKVDPPSQVIDAFRDVQAARADAERAQNEAQAYANKIVPEARGEAARHHEAATGYKTRTVERSARSGLTASSRSMRNTARRLKWTRERMYLDNMERVCSVAWTR